MRATFAVVLLINVIQVGPSIGAFVVAAVLYFLLARFL
jgi:hypothetical protein